MDRDQALAQAKALVLVVWETIGENLKIQIERVSQLQMLLTLYFQSGGAGALFVSQIEWLMSVIKITDPHGELDSLRKINEECQAELKKRGVIATVS
jgi:hypothetical protein